MEPLPSAPPVVAVVVASDPGDWLEQTLAALGAQDYPNFSALAVDAGTVGVAHPLVERGELDQEQHDGVRDVFAVPGACTLVRSDLFTSLRGFDVVMADHGSDVDLCWRAQALGARVMVAPAARVRHLEAERRRVSDDGDEIVL